MGIKLTEWQLVSDLLQLAKNDQLSTSEYLAVGRLGVCLTCLAQGVVKLGFAHEYTENYWSWPMSVRFCVQMLQAEGLVADVVENLRRAIRGEGVADDLRDSLAGITSIMDDAWIHLPLRERKALALIFRKLLDSKDPRLAAERIFGASTIAGWGLELDMSDDYELVPAAIETLKSMSLPQLAHISDHGELALLCSAGVLHEGVLEELSESAREYLLAVNLGL